MEGSDSPIQCEKEAAEAELSRGSEEWLSWWRQTGARELRCILMTAWDSVGTGDTAEAWDEYDSYDAAIALRLRDAASDEEAAERVADYVNHVEREHMRIVSAERRRENGFLAMTPVAWHEWSYLRGGRSPREWIDEDPVDPATPLG